MQIFMAVVDSVQSERRMLIVNAPCENKTRSGCTCHLDELKKFWLDLNNPVFACTDWWG